jgi:hypothetical protein
MSSIEPLQNCLAQVQKIIHFNHYDYSAKKRTMAGEAWEPHSGSQPNLFVLIRQTVCIVYDRHRIHANFKSREHCLS